MYKQCIGWSWSPDQENSELCWVPFLNRCSCWWYFCRRFRSNGVAGPHIRCMRSMEFGIASSSVPSVHDGCFHGSTNSVFNSPCCFCRKRSFFVLSICIAERLLVELLARSFLKVDKDSPVNCSWRLSVGLVSWVWFERGVCVVRYRGWCGPDWALLIVRFDEDSDKGEALRCSCATDRACSRVMADRRSWTPRAGGGWGPRPTVGDSFLIWPMLMTGRDTL